MVVFGTKAYAVQDPILIARGRSILEERIAGLSPTGTQNTYLDTGVQLAWEMLNTSEGKGDLIILSDGKLYNYPDVYSHSIQLIRQMNATTRMIQVQAFPGAGRGALQLSLGYGSGFCQLRLSGLRHHQAPAGSGGKTGGGRCHYQLSSGRGKHQSLHHL